MHNNKEITGIYILINKRTDEVYVGQSINIDARCKRHFNELKKGTHNNSDLQEDYDKGDKFSIKIIEEINISDYKKLKKELKSKEVYWIHKYRSYLAGYNKTPGGEYDELIGDIDHSGGRLGGQYSSKVIEEDSWDLKNVSKIKRFYGTFNNENEESFEINENFNYKKNIKTDKEILINKLHQITGEGILKESFLEMLNDFNLDVFSAHKIVNNMEKYIEHNNLDVNIDLNKYITQCIEKELSNQIKN